ncbi:MAG TPA: site-specific DNA-methyltransferase [Solirubrobacteraceae bacterium]|jgi:site-specific DNA-methyltransferase (adenine-specific)|nr:site-specific DNA-methyltransferase [Solirubrobacteraceae bacterium]
MINRARDFEQIEARLRADVVGAGGDYLIVEGDSLATLRALPDACVSLIVTDPPYHSTKKANVHGDTAFDEDDDFLRWMEDYASEWKRILKLSGSAYVFCASQMAARLEVSIGRHMRPIGQITWTKPNDPGFDGWKGKARKQSLRSWYPHSERVLMFEQGTYGSREAHRRSPLGEYLLACRGAAALSMIELTEQIGAYGHVNRGGAVANWEAGRYVPSRGQYSRLAAALQATGRIAPMLPYEDVVRPFTVDGDVPFTDVWHFPSVRPFPGKHPAEKPLAMLSHMISASSYSGDIVLDCFSGSGSTALAATGLARRAVCVEIDPSWNRAAANLLCSNCHADVERGEVSISA